MCLDSTTAVITIVQPFQQLHVKLGPVVQGSITDIQWGCDKLVVYRLSQRRCILVASAGTLGGVFVNMVNTNHVWLVMRKIRQIGRFCSSVIAF